MGNNVIIRLQWTLNLTVAAGTERPSREPRGLPDLAPARRRAFHFSIHVAGGHAGPDADATLRGARFVARDRSPAHATCGENLQAHAGTRGVREVLQRRRVGRVA